jgi:serine/threonine-protein kinase
MAVAKTVDLIEALRRNMVLEPAQLDQLERTLRIQYPEPKSLAGELLQRGWLTAYQANQLLQGRGDGLVLGAYVLLERLGEGGMGEVFKARHQKLGRIVALKVIRKERLDNPDNVRRFQREIRAAAQLSHPNIVHAFDADQAGDTHFFVMEYIEGIDLKELVSKSGPRPLAQACDYIRQAALGLQHAHERGLVHRDIKPSNLLLTTTDHSPLTTHQIKLLDLGLARLEVAADDDSSGPLTQEGLVMGTFDYLAPEQAKNSHTVDIRADLYSLGCTFYFLLTGRAPFAGASQMDKLLKHQWEEPTPVEKLRAEVPPNLAAVVRKLMAKKPAERYQTPAELAATLETIGQSVPDTHAKPRRNRLASAQPDQASTETGARWASVVATTSTEALVAPPGPRRRMAPGRPVLLFGVSVALVLGGVAFLAFLLNRQPRILDENDHQPASKPSLFDLNPEAIPAEERFPWQPKELVAVLGTHRGRHWGEVRGLAYHPGGRVVASVSDDPFLRLWDAGTLRQLLEIKIAPTSVAFSSDGRTLVAGAKDGTVHLYTVQVNEASQAALKETEVMRFSDAHAVNAVALSPDGKLLAAGVQSGIFLGLLGGKQTEVKRHISTENGWVLSLLFSSDGKILIAAGGGPKLQLWDLTVDPAPKPKLLKTYSTVIKCVAYDPGRKLLACGMHAGALVQLWDLSGAEPKAGAIWETYGARHLTALAFSPDGKTLASSNGSSHVQLWDVTGDKPKQRSLITGFAAIVNALSFSTHGRSLATGGDDQTVRLWDVAGPAPRERLPIQGPRPAIGCLAFSANGKHLALASTSERTARLWSLHDDRMKERAVSANHNDRVTSLAFSPDGGLLASGSIDRTVRLWDVAGAKERSALKPGGLIGGLVFSPDGRTLAVGVQSPINTSYNGELRRWELDSGKELASVDLVDTAGVPFLAYTPNGKTIAAVHRGTVALVDAGRAKPRLSLLLTDFVQCMALSRDGTAVAAGDRKGVFRVWDAQTGESQASIDGGEAIQAVVFAGRGESLILADAKGRVSQWDRDLKKRLRSWEFPGKVAALAVAADGHHLATANANGTVYILRLP